MASQLSYESIIENALNYKPQDVSYPLLKCVEDNSEKGFNQRKFSLLENLKGKSKYKYKRYKGMPLRYAGGKSLAVGHVVERLPYVKKIVSPFFGGGSVEIAIAKELGVEVVGYDIFDILVNYWQVQLKNPQSLTERIAQWKPTKETYCQVKQTLKGHWTRDKIIKDRLDLAAHYWFNHNLSYGPGFLGWMSSIYLDEQRYLRALSRILDFQLSSNMSVKKGSFEKTITTHTEDFLYCDPPYYLEGDSKMFRGIYPQRNFPVHHNGFDHEELAKLLKNHKGGFILSYNDCEAVRNLYSDFEIIEVEWQYTLGQGETRIGANRIEAGTTSNIKKSHELMIVKNENI